MFQLLERNVDLLDNIQMSELNNVSYSQYNCTLRQVVLPFLSKTVSYESITRSIEKLKGL